MHDDLLDLYADPEKFGKQVGGDILSNKKTFLLLKAYEMAEQETKTEIDNILNNQKGQVKIDNIKVIFEQLGVRQITEDQKELFYQKALLNMKEINVPEANKIELLDLAKYLMSRDH
jgi:geranylgeranyl diphosphate synthase type II